ATAARKTRRFRLAQRFTAALATAIVLLTPMVAAIRPACATEPTGWSTPLDRAAPERGRTALLIDGFLKPEWGAAADGKVARQWEGVAPDPDKDPVAYDAAFRNHYGLHPAPYPNDGLPMGLRRGIVSPGQKAGLQIDCMLCHAGSIGGQSYVGLGNTQLD